MQQLQQQKNRVPELIKSKVSLAPMAGITDYVLRSLVRKYSKECLLTTEMISSEFLAQNVETEITKLDESHHPIVYQICGHKPHLMKYSAEYLTKFADMIDINMGCPVNKVVKGQDGSALMRNPRLAMDLVRAVKEGTNKPVSVKFRLGYTADEMNYVEFGQQMQEAGAVYKIDGIALVNCEIFETYTVFFSSFSISHKFFCIFFSCFYFSSCMSHK